MRVPNDKNVLLVEDDPAVRKYLVCALQHLGFGVSTCDTVRTASPYLEEASLDVILADYVLPDKSGTELVRLSTEHTQQRPIIGMSVEHSRGNEMLDAGAMAFLKKPIGLNRLQDVMEKAMTCREQALTCQEDEAVGDNKAMVRSETVIARYRQTIAKREEVITRRKEVVKNGLQDLKPKKQAES